MPPSNIYTRNFLILLPFSWRSISIYFSMNFLFLIQVSSSGHTVQMAPSDQCHLETSYTFHLTPEPDANTGKLIIPKRIINLHEVFSVPKEHTLQQINSFADIPKRLFNTSVRLVPASPTNFPRTPRNLHRNPAFP